jgi:ABC-type amino acid transport system permease subunit
MRVFSPILVWEFFPRILAFIPVTLAILFASILFSLVAGSLFYLIRLKKIPVLSPIHRVRMSFIRGTPVITQLFWFILACRFC